MFNATSLNDGILYNWVFEMQRRMGQLIFALLNLRLDWNVCRVIALLASVVGMMKNTQRLATVDVNDYIQNRWNQLKRYKNPYETGN